MPKESNLELKVGIFVVCAVACLVAFIFSISDFSIFQGGQVYRVMFTYANGLKKNAPVRISGVDTGHVRSIKPYFDKERGRIMILAEAWIDDGMLIPEDSVFMVNQLGLLGEKYLEIMPGTASTFMAAGSVVAGEDSLPMETVLRNLSSLSDKVEVVLNDIHTGIMTEMNKQSLSAALYNIAELTGKIDNGLLTEANQKALARMLANMAAVTEKINNSEGTVGKFLSDPSFYNNLDELSADVKANPWKLFYRPKKK